VITLPVAVHTDAFRWQLDLFWFADRMSMGRGARARAHAIVIKCNDVRDTKAERMIACYRIALIGQGCGATSKATGTPGIPAHSPCELTHERKNED
jgi:hypothetical protein